MKSHVVRRSQKRQLSNGLAKAVVGAITKFGEMIVMLEKEKIEPQRQQVERDERMFEIQAKMQYNMAKLFAWGSNDGVGLGN